jgi:hypothetical protein
MTMTTHLFRPMSKSNSSSSDGIGFGGALFLLFLGLRLAGVIDWPWIWVFAPIWIPLALLGVIGAVVVIIAWCQK